MPNIPELPSPITENDAATAFDAFLNTDPGDSATVEEDVTPEVEETEETEDTLEASEETDDTDEQADEPSEEEPESAIEPPVSWSAEEQEAFKQAPAPVQAAIARREAEREKAISSAKRETAQERDQFQQYAQQIANERQSYAQRLDPLLQNLEMTIQSDGAMARQLLDEGDTEGYLRLQAQTEQNRQLQQQAMAERQRLMAEHAQQQQYQRQFFLQREWESLTEALPAWKDKTVASREMGALGDYLKGEGFTDQEVGMVADHRQFLIARKAMLYDKFQAEKREVVSKKVANKPKVTKPGTAQRQPPQLAQANKVRAAQANLRKNPKSRDAAVEAFTALGIK